MRKLSIRSFVPSLRSDWNNGNAHFLRGLARGLVSLGHDLISFEPEKSWSHENLLAVEGKAGRASEAYFYSTYPELRIELYSDEGSLEQLFEQLQPATRETDIVLVHEWSSPLLVSALMALRARYRFRMLFHDTHHRASSSPQDLARLQVRSFDAVVAFGEALQRIYKERLGITKTFVLHEAADTTVFRPRPSATRPVQSPSENNPDKLDVLWIGNWGDGERNRELHTYLIDPAKALPRSRFTVYGVRYPREGVEALAEAGIAYGGYLQNLCAPLAYANASVSLHIPRQQYVEALTGIPTIRVFEALASGVPLVCSPWTDSEQLFPAHSFRMAHSGEQMVAMISELLKDEPARRQQAAEGLQCIQDRHTCMHRSVELTAICEEVLA